MSYTSYSYLLIFLSIVFIAYTLMPKNYKWIVLLISSYAFYWLNSGRLIIYLLLTTVVVYSAGIFLNKIQEGFRISSKVLEKEQKKQLKGIILWQKKAVIGMALFLIFGILLILKYSSFFGMQINSLSKLLNINFHLHTARFILPLGISYYTLQAASYIIDVYRGKYKATDNFGKVALFLCYFPQIVEGPIGRYDLLGEQLYEGHDFNYENFTQGLQLIFWGLFKKLVIADRANIFISTVYSDYDKYSGSIILLAAILFTIQIYAEFSGCMDIVTGSSQLFSVGLSKNFDRPFFSKSVGEFWRRWHITLGAWLKEYIFYSISLSKPFMKLSKHTKAHLNEFAGSMVPASCALFFTWFGIGFWHGAGWKYIVYGLYYYAIMMVGMYCEPLITKFFQSTRIKRDSMFLNGLRIIRTLIFVLIGMMMFRAAGLTAFFDMFGRIFTDFRAETFLTSALNCGIDLDDFIIIGLGTVVILIISLIQEKGINVRESLGKQVLPVRWAAYLCLILAVVIFGAYGIGYDRVDFIYGQF